MFSLQSLIACHLRSLLLDFFQNLAPNYVIQLEMKAYLLALHSEFADTHSTDESRERALAQLLQQLDAVSR